MERQTSLRMGFIVTKALMLSGVLRSSSQAFVPYFLSLSCLSTVKSRRQRLQKFDSFVAAQLDKAALLFCYFCHNLEKHTSSVIYTGRRISCLIFCLGRQIVLVVKEAGLFT